MWCNLFGQGPDVDVGAVSGEESPVDAGRYAVNERCSSSARAQRRSCRILADSWKLPEPGLRPRHPGQVNLTSYLQEGPGTRSQAERADGVGHLSQRSE
jgi:hypothetical protein